MTQDTDLTKHLVAALFAKTAQIIEASPRRELEDQLERHENMLLALMNHTRLLQLFVSASDERKPLTASVRGIPQRADAKDGADAGQPAIGGSPAQTGATRAVGAQVLGKEKAAA